MHLKITKILLIIPVGLIFLSQAFAGECVVSGVDQLKDAVTKASSDRCIKDSSDFLARYGDYYPGVTKFNVIRFSRSQDIIVNQSFPNIINNSSSPLLIYADDDVDVKFTGSNVNAGLVLSGNKIIIDHLIIEKFNNSGVVIEGDNNLVIRSTLASNKVNGILVTGDENRIVDNKITSNGVNGVFVGGNVLPGNVCEDDPRTGYGTIIIGCEITQNGNLLNESSCKESISSDNLGSCYSLKLETEKCHSIFIEEDKCEEPNTLSDDECSIYWIFKNRCLNLFDTADASIDDSLDDALIKVYASFNGSNGGDGILIDAGNVKVTSYQPSPNNINIEPIFQSLIANNKNKGIYVNSIPVSMFCNNESLLDSNKLQTALVSKMPVDSLAVSRFPLPEIKSLSAVANFSDMSISGSIRLTDDAWYPWNERSVDKNSLKAQIFVKNAGNGMISLLGEASLEDSGRFVLNTGLPLQIDREIVRDPVFIATVVDEEHGNTSPLNINDAIQHGGEVDDDNDGLSNREEDLDLDGNIDAGETDPLNPDTDGDGLTDGEEKLHRGLDPLNPDSDGDCIPDGVEKGVSKQEAEDLIKQMPKKPRIVITEQCIQMFQAQNGEGIANAILYDTSSDASWNNIMMLYDMDPLTTTEPTSADTDDDRLSDGMEDRNFNGVQDKKEDENTGVVTFLETDPNLSDTDDDGIVDGEEGDRDDVSGLGADETDPLNADTDNDGIKDGEERRIGTYPNACDSDEDGLSDGVEKGAILPSSAGSGCHGLQAAGTNYNNVHVMDPLNPDSDGDGLMDGVEDANGNGWVDTYESDPSIADTDFDGLSDGVEAKGNFDLDGIPDFELQLVANGPKCSPPEDISDLDCDGVPNWIDIDSDEDGCPDSREGNRTDYNSNTIPDVYDSDAKACTGDDSGGGGSISFGGGGSSNDEQNETPAYSNSTPNWLFDQTGGGACSLVKPATNFNIWMIVFIYSSICLLVAVRKCFKGYC